MFLPLRTPPVFPNSITRTHRFAEIANLTYTHDTRWMLRNFALFDETLNL